MQLPAVTTKAEVSFAEVAMPLPAADLTHTPYGAPAAVIKCNGFAIELSNNISEALLSRLLKEVYHA